MGGGAWEMTSGEEDPLRIAVVSYLVVWTGPNFLSTTCRLFLFVADYELYAIIPYPLHPIPRPYCM
jgi:hypothetical protein